MSDQPHRERFGRAGALLAVVGVASAVVTFVVQARAPGGDVGNDASLVRVVAAVVLSAATVPLLLAWRADRGALGGGDDRLAGSYLAAGALGVVVCALVGAAPGAAVCAGVVAATGWARRDAPGAHDEFSRQAWPAVVVAAATCLAAFAAGALYETYAVWDLGLAAGTDAERDWIGARGGEVVLLVASVAAAVATAVLPWLMVRHRRLLAGSPGVAERATGAAFALTALCVLAGSAPGVATGLVSLAAALACLVRRRARGLPRTRDHRPGQP